MRATALGFATEYAVAVNNWDSETMSPADIVAMAEVFLDFLMAGGAPTAADGAVAAVQQDAAAQDTAVQEAPVEASVQEAPSEPEQPAQTAQPVEPPPPAPPPPPEAPLPESPAPAVDLSPR
jgi:outer membrane biosynthesis protein TonB